MPPNAIARVCFRCVWGSAAATKVTAHAFAARIGAAQAAQRVAQVRAAQAAVAVVRSLARLLLLLLPLALLPGLPLLLLPRRVRVACAVVGVRPGRLLPVGIGQQVVSFVDLLHLLLGQIFERMVLIIVRVVLFDQFPVSLLDFLACRPRLDAKHVLR